MRSWILAALAVGALGCSKKPHMDLPTYPGAAGMAGGSVSESDSCIVFHSIMRTPDSAPMVRAFYAKELETTRGWKTQGGGTGSAWNNGNMTWVGGGSFGNATANDPTQEGGFVQLIETDRETVIDHWQSRPLPRKK